MLSYNEFSIRNSFLKNHPEPCPASPKEDLHIAIFLNEFIKDKKPFYLIVEEFNQSINEGILSRVVGGLTGLALGKSIGGFLVRVFQLQPGTVLYKILTSSLFYMAVGAAFGRDIKKTPSTS